MDPKDAKFLTYSKAMEKEPQSDFDDDSEIEKVTMLDSEGNGTENEDEGAETTQKEASKEADKDRPRLTYVEDIWKRRSKWRVQDDDEDDGWNWKRAVYC